MNLTEIGYYGIFDQEPISNPKQKKWLEFNTIDDAEIALQQINNNKGLPNQNAQSWDIIIETINNTFVFLRPEQIYMVGVENYQVIDIDQTLIPQNEVEQND